MIKAVIFDIDNTLYSYDEAHPVAYQALKDYAFGEFGWSGEEFDRIHQRAQRELKTVMGDVAAIHNRLIRYQNMLEAEGLPLFPHALHMEALYWDTLIEASSPSPGAEAAMAALKTWGVRIGIGTDMTARVQLRKLTHLGLLPYIDFMVSSEEASVEKPSAALFERCVQKSGCQAAECLFVGDSLKKDYYGALGAGLQAVWYRPGGQSGEEALQITDLGQLPELAAGLSAPDGQA